MKVTKETVIRTIILALALINNVLTMLGKNPIPYSETAIYEIVSTIFTVAASIWAWWKNNSFTKSAIKADEMMKELKKEDKEENKK